MNQIDIDLPSVVSRDDWRATRIELHERENNRTRKRDELNTARRRLPIVRDEEDSLVWVAGDEGR